MKNQVIKLVLFAAILMISSGQTNAQNVQWSKTGISQGFENGNAICTDDSGNVYVTGQFEYSSVFDNYTLNSYGQHDIMTIKYASNGTIKWIKKAGGRSGDIGSGIGIDAAHNVYITGEVEDTVSFGSGISVISNGSNDGFIAKYDVNGKILWAKCFGSELGSDKGRALAVSPAGNCYITGNYTYSTNFDGITLSTNGGNDLFVAKFNTDGNIVWAKSAGGTSQDRGYGIAVDASENVFVTGTFTQSANFGSINVTDPGTNSSFLAKYNSLGQIQWVRNSGACCDTTKANALALDANGNIYMTGMFKQTTQFGSNTFTAHGTSDIFIVKYNSTGDVEWAKQAGGSSEDEAYGVAVDNLNQLVYITGFVQTHGYFGTIYYSTKGYKDDFLAAYDLNGNSQWVKTYGGIKRDIGLAIAVDNAGYIYNTGLFNDTATFDTHTLYGFPNEPWADFFVNKISPAQAIVPALQAGGISSSQVNCSDLNISVTPGSGSSRIIVMRAGSAITTSPVNGTDYLADNVFGSGSDLGNGTYVVSNGNASNVTVTGLNSGTTYYFAAYEYNGFGMASNYLTSSPANSSASVTSPSINISGLQNSLCNGESVTLQASGAITYSWSPANGLSSVTGSVVTATPASTTGYTLTGTTLAGCVVQSNFTIIVNPLPVVSFAALNSVCINGSSVALTGGTPAGGIYSGTGVNAGQFNPAASRVGTTSVLYTFTDANGCVDKAQSTIAVKAIPAVSFSSLPSVCENDGALTLNQGLPLGGAYTGVGVTSGKFNPSVGHGSYTITYSYTDNNGCAASTTQTEIVKAIPTVDLGTDVLSCAGNSVTVNAGTGYSTYHWSNGATTSSIVVDSNGTGLGSKNVSVTVSSANGCSNSDNMHVTFDLCAGTDDMASIGSESIYPNPFHDGFTLRTERTISFAIFDACGRLLDKKENVAGTISAGEDLAPGVYFIQVQSGLSSRTYQVLKQQ